MKNIRQKILILSLAWIAQVEGAELSLPPIVDGIPAPGKRVAITPPEFAGTRVHHMLYLPPDWSADWKARGQSWPVIVEYTGNYFPEADSTGRVEDAALGFGISSGQFIWVTLPYVSADHTRNEVTWWGDEQVTVEYAKNNMPRICAEFGGNPGKVILCGFSRGAIAANYIGLHDDEIASLWSGFVTHDHYDGVRAWKGTTWGTPLAVYRESALERLRRLKGRPVLVCQNGSTDDVASYLRESTTLDNFTFVDVNIPGIFPEFPNELAIHPHTDRWLLKDSPDRRRVWDWASQVLNRPSPLPSSRPDLAADAKRERPNILFILSDDHALEAIGAYGSWLKDYVQTPTIDRLAEEGMRFTNVCCNNSICSPSRASIITGQYSHTNGGLNLNCSLREDAPSYNQQFQTAGYQTAVVGKWHMRHMPRGMDFYAVTKGQGRYFNPRFTESDGSKTNHQGYYADVYTDTALNWLRNRDKDKPFCLNLHFKGPHHPYDYPERHESLLADTLVPEPSSLHEDLAETSPLLKEKHRWHMLRNHGYFGRHVEDTTPKMWPHDGTDESKTSAAYQHMVHKYIRCVAAIDENVKRVVDYLETEGIKDDTLIVYTSDQGYWLGQHGLYDKRLILEESLKMPLIVRYPPRIKAGTVNTDLVSNVDFAPTFLEMAGIKPDVRMQGRSIVPLLAGRTPDDWRQAIWYAYWAGGHPHWGMRSKRFKLALFPDTDQFEFYDLQEDLQEMTNLARNPDYADFITEARRTVQDLMRHVNIQPNQLPGQGERAKSNSSTR